MGGKFDSCQAIKKCWNCMGEDVGSNGSQLKGWPLPITGSLIQHGKVIIFFAGNQEVIGVKHSTPIKMHFVCEMSLID